MTVASTTSANVKQAVPFFGVTNMEASLRFYFDGLGFKMKRWWIPDRAEDNPDGKIRWCCLSLAKPPSCFRSSCRSADRRRRWAPEHRSLSCAKTRWRSIANSNHVEFRRGNVHSWATVSG